MTKGWIRGARAALAIGLLAAATRAQDPVAADPELLLDRMHAAYAALDSYAHRGVQTIRVRFADELPEFLAEQNDQRRAFRLRYDRDRGVLFESRMQAEMGLGMSLTIEHAALWRTADGYRYWEKDFRDETFSDPADALELADGSLEGVAGIALPSLLGVRAVPGGLGREPEFEPPVRDPLDGRPCWRIDYRVAAGDVWHADYKLWIDEESHLIRRVDWVEAVSAGSGRRVTVQLDIEPGAAVTIDDVVFAIPEKGNRFGFGTDEGWEFATRDGSPSFDVPAWLPWTLIGGALAVAALFFVLLRRAARSHRARPVVPPPGR